MPKSKSISISNINSYIINLFIRYIIILLLAINGLFIIYWLLRPATLYAVVGVLSLFGDVAIISNVAGSAEFLFSSLSVELIDACVAGSAFYLLLILNLTTPMKADKRIRIKSLAFSIISLFVLNILRIVLLVLVANKNLSSFNSIHLLFWYLLSIIMVVGVWLATIKVFMIENIPVYSDVGKIAGLIKRR